MNVWILVAHGVCPKYRQRCLSGPGCGLCAHSALRPSGAVNSVYASDELGKQALVDEVMGEQPKMTIEDKEGLLHAYWYYYQTDDGVERYSLERFRVYGGVEECDCRDALAAAGQSTATARG